MAYDDGTDFAAGMPGGGLLGSGSGGSSWLGNLFNFGGGRSTTADLYGDLFTKKQLAAIQQRESQAKMAGLLNVFSQAAAPSKFKKDWGQILGQAGGAMLGATGGDTAAQGALTGTLTAQKIKQLQAELAAQEAARKINQTIYGRLFGGGAPAGAAAPAPPVPAGVVSQPGPAPGPDVAPSPVAPPRPVGSYGGPGGGQQPLPFPTFGGGAPAPPGGPPMQPASFAPQGQPDQMLAGLLGGAAQPPFSQEEPNPMGGILGGPGLPPPDEVLASDRPPFAGGMPPVQQTAGLTGSQWEIANHNYGGMRKPGVNASPSQGGFQSFPNAEAGLQAISRQLDRYASGATTGKPLTTIRGIVSTWAPPSENPTATLVARAAKIMGVDPDQPLDLSDPLTKAKLITATIANEQGGRVPVDPELIAQVASAPPGSVSGLDEVVGQRRGVPGFTRAQYAPSGGAPAASGGVSDIIPGLGVSPAELALVDSINEQAKLGTPFKAFLDAYYKTPGYLGQATTAQELAKDPFARNLATHNSQLQLFRELAAKGLSIVPDGKGGFTMGTISGAPDALAAGDNAKATSDQKEYQSYVKDQQMRNQPVLSQFDWDIARRKSSATSINTTEGMEAAQTRARLAIDQKAAQEATEVAMAARRTMPLLDQVLELADKTPGGWAGPASATMAKAFSAVGIPVSEGMSNAELLQSIGQRLIPIVREPGATAAVEMDAYLRAVPGLMQSTEGRRKVADMTKAIAQRSIEIARVYRENVGAPNLYEKLAELDKPVFTPAQRAALETQPAVRTYNPATGKLE